MPQISVEDWFSCARLIRHKLAEAVGACFTLCRTVLGLAVSDAED